MEWVPGPPNEFLQEVEMAERVEKVKIQRARASGQWESWEDQ